jgi:hypothetical protein
MPSHHGILLGGWGIARPWGQRTCADRGVRRCTAITGLRKSSFVFSPWVQVESAGRGQRSRRSKVRVLPGAWERAPVAQRQVGRRGRCSCGVAKRPRHRVHTPASLVRIQPPQPTRNAGAPRRACAGYVGARLGRVSRNARCSVIRSSSSMGSLRRRQLVRAGLAAARAF